MSLPSTFVVYGKDLKPMDVKTTDLKEEFLKIVLVINHQVEVSWYPRIYISKFPMG